MPIVDFAPDSKFEILDADKSDPKIGTFIFHKEDHTLGNALCRILNRNPEVIFCGYTIPHPSEHKINIRIQTKNTPAIDILKYGLSELQKVCEHMLKTFKNALNEYEENCVDAQ